MKLQRLRIAKRILLTGKKMRLFSVMIGMIFICAIKTGTACANETLVDAWKRQMQESSGASDKEKYNQAPQLSVDDICEMNQGNAVFLYNEQGYVSFLQGKIL